MALNQLVSATSMVIAGNLNKVLCNEMRCHKMSPLLRQLLASVIGAYIFSNSVTPHTVAGKIVELVVCAARP